MSNARLPEITETNFGAEVLNTPAPILIDFSAVWCAPCRAIAPHVEAIAAAYQGRVRVATCDIDDSPQLAAELGVRGVPTLIAWSGGRPVGQIVGAVPRARIEQLVERALAAAPTPTTEAAPAQTPAAPVDGAPLPAAIGR